MLHQAVEENQLLQQKFNKQIERHLARADAIRQWVAGKEGAYDGTIKALIGLDAIALDPKRLALAAATVPMYLRAFTPQKSQRGPSRHVGTIGQGHSAILTVYRVDVLESNLCYQTLVLLRDAVGNKYVWRRNGSPKEIADSWHGLRLDAYFQIKAHKKYKGSAQTLIRAVRVFRYLPPALPAARSRSRCSSVCRIVFSRVPQRIRGSPRVNSPWHAFSVRPPSPTRKTALPLDV